MPCCHDEMIKCMKSSLHPTRLCQQTFYAYVSIPVTLLSAYPNAFVSIPLRLCQKNGQYLSRYRIDQPLIFSKDWANTKCIFVKFNALLINSSISYFVSQGFSPIDCFHWLFIKYRPYEQDSKKLQSKNHQYSILLQNAKWSTARAESDRNLESIALYYSRAMPVSARQQGPCSEPGDRRNNP